MPSLLLIEDDPIVSKVYRNKLSAEGFTVRVAMDGEQAIEAVKQARPDIVLLDLMLPKIDGLEVLRFIRAQAASKDVPVVVFSNSFASTVIQEAWAAGATQCLTKVDCTPRQVVEIMHKLLAGTAAAVPPAAQPVTPVVQPPAPVAVPAAPVPSPVPVAPPSPVPVAVTPPPAPVPPPVVAPPAPLPVVVPPMVSAPVASAPPPVLASVPPPTPAVVPTAVAVPTVAVPVAPPAPASAPTIQDELAFQEQLRQSFLLVAPTMLASLRGFFQNLVKGDTAAKQVALQEMLTVAHSLASNVGLTGQKRFGDMINALEALIKELIEKPKNINQSTIRTTAFAIEALQTLLREGEPTEAAEPLAPLVLVVDDEVISRRTVAQALQRARLRSIQVEDPSAALRLAVENRFDLIFLDVEMPGMTGFELCAKLRTLPLHKTTPVVFVTTLADFGSRSKSAQSGGNDLIGKPFMLIELAVKALTYLVQIQRKPASPA